MCVPFEMLLGDKHSVETAGFRRYPKLAKKLLGCWGQISLSA
jgi:hypothetical protein